jgi:hypothetical protein
MSARKKLSQPSARMLGCASGVTLEVGATCGNEFSKVGVPCRLGCYNHSV